jgi:hypothetical protein
MRPKRSAAALLVWLILSAVPAFAWNDEGHMVVAYAAYEQLQPAVRQRVITLLQLNPDYAKWQAVLPPTSSKADAQRMLFMIAATWADQIRGDRRYADDGLYGGYIPYGSDSSLNVGYSDYLRHLYWHSIVLFFSQDGTPLPEVPRPNVQTQIAAFRAVLRSNAPDGLKSYDLVWLEHLVGDVHQPLHASARVSKYLPESDAGGNLIRLCSPPCNDTLHAFWDRMVGSDASIGVPAAQNNLAAELASAINVAKSLPAPDAHRAEDLSEASWVQEALEVAKQRVYVAPIGPGVGPYTITPEYFDAAKALAAEQVALAGARLANLLNSELK